MRTEKSNHRGFTLIELISNTAIIALLAGIANGVEK
jgi:prepilin-type N-terminal cleavage/methylation domain-containing protein